MNFINPFGLFYMILIMIPNIVFAVKVKGGFENWYQNKLIERLEQIGRYGCFVFMILNFPFCSVDFASKAIFDVYLIANSVFVFAYCIIWIFFFNRESMFKAISLSVLPCVVFLLSGIAGQNIFLIIFALIFSPCHIILSVKNVKKSPFSTK